MVQSKARGWTAAQAGEQSGRVAVVTGANSGIGLETARALAVAGATVVLACRDVGRAEAARAAIAESAPDAQVRVEQLDLAALASITDFAGRLPYPAIDLLINNAGVMAAARGTTADGFEIDFGTNFLGPFALTGRLLDRLAAAPAARIVTVGSHTDRTPSARLDFEDLQSEKGFRTSRTYARSKLAVTTFMVELDRRLTAAGSSTRALGAHPGGVRTGILNQQNRLLRAAFDERLARLTNWFSQSPADGARAILRAALDPAAQGGDYFGPGGRNPLVGPPERVPISRPALDPVLGARLWGEAEKLTGVRYLGG
ncbi:oxidoreductase [Nocardia asteroides]|uniref:oxidoreductase n=1 Tax=Nocardia asteroides TaxID=1824 RepID=UPI001E33E5AE|nr:oxidoreductase [Nocardia asteroides]UGT62726.1 SDR family NAD(P)-dependent oxidoreductase [Nocardia asteroides]